jgi:carbon-monoxide dehydrogenase iron sulfur subunit
VFDPKEMQKKDSLAENSNPEKGPSNPSRRDVLRGMALGAGAVALSSIVSRKAEAIDIDVFAMKPSLRGEVVAAGRLSHDPRKCVGCRVCEVACAMKNHGEVNPFKSRIRIYTYQPTVFVGIVCQQCGDRPCVEACPVEPDKDGRKALYEDPKTKSLAVNAQRCIHCGNCVEACATHRNGNLRMNEDDVPDGFCVLCGECVKQCPQDALGILPRTTDGKYAAKKADLIAKEIIETIYGGPKTIVDNWK